MERSQLCPFFPSSKIYVWSLRFMRSKDSKISFTPVNVGTLTKRQHSLAHVNCKDSSPLFEHILLHR